MRSFLLWVFGVAVMISIVPLSVAAGSGSWRAAWTALREYLLIIGGMVGIAGAFSLLYWVYLLIA